MWVMVDLLIRSMHFLANRVAFTLEEILPVVYPRDFSATWSASVHSVGLRSQIYGALLEELPKGHRDTVDDEHRFSPTDQLSVGEDYPGSRGHAASVCPIS